MRNSLLALAAVAMLFPHGRTKAEDLMVMAGEPGRSGGSLVVAQRAEPKTLNPVTAIDAPSREVIRRMMADLITIDRESHKTGPGLAKSWRISKDGLRYTLELRQGIRFSDGHPFDADDVVFTFEAYLDESVHSPQRDLLLIGDRPLRVRKLSQYSVLFEFPKPYGAAERIFDSIAILPRHLLQPVFREGKLAQAWSLTSAPSSLAGLGPFRLKSYSPGDRIVLERNPYYWKTDAQGKRLPYLDQLVFLAAGAEDVQMVRFLAGETQIMPRMGARNFAVMTKDPAAKDARLVDVGPSLEYNFLFFNLNPPDAARQPEIAARQEWFQDRRFRQAVSAAIDRDAIVKLVFDSRATPLPVHVTPANKLWLNRQIAAPRRDVARARQLLRDAGFRWDQERLLDGKGGRVEFSILVASSSTERTQMAALIEQDLKQLGIGVIVTPFEFRAMLDRVLKTHQYEACLLGLGGGDPDPNSEMNVWLSNGGTHLWKMSGPALSWETEVDTLMQRQLVSLKYEDRKRAYDRVQEIVSTEFPIIPLASPHVLVAARQSVGNFRPVVLDHSTLWNVEQLFLRDRQGGR